MSEIGRHTGDASLPYIFISYAHRNSKTVLPIIECFARHGARLWYDGGIELGKEWAADVERHIVECEVFLLFLSHDYVDSLNCREEFALAREAKRNILVCYIEDLRPDELKHGLRLQIPSHQCIFISRFGSAEELFNELCAAEMIIPCVERGSTVSEKTDECPDKNTGAAKSAASDVPFPKISSTAHYAKAAVKTVASVVASKAAEYAGLPISPDKGTKAPLPKRAYEYSSGLEINEMGLLLGIGGCTDRDIIVPQNVRGIANGAFKGCRRIESIVLPVGIKVIPNDAFHGCKNLKSVRLSVYTTHIGARAFYNCRRLETLDFIGDKFSGDKPHGFQFVQAKAFMNCISYSPHWVGGERMIELGERAYYNCGIVQGGFYPCIRKIGRLALGKRWKTHANTVYFTGSFQEWQQVKRNGKIMSCRVQYVKCNNGHDGFITEYSTDHIFE